MAPYAAKATPLKLAIKRGETGTRRRRLARLHRETLHGHEKKLAAFILFLPDKYLGMYIAAKTGKRIEIWDGQCHVHARLTSERIFNLAKIFSDAEFLIHPECGCGTACLVKLPELGLKVKFLSTEGMVKYVKESPAKRFVVATETGILYKMRKAAPDKELIPAAEDAVCEYMKLITLEKVYKSLRDEVYVVTVPPQIAERARRAIERMFEFA